MRRNVVNVVLLVLLMTLLIVVGYFIGTVLLFVYA